LRGYEVSNAEPPRPVEVGALQIMPVKVFGYSVKCGERTVGNRITTAFLMLATAVALYACYFIAKPFFKPVAFAAAIGIIFGPVHARIRRLIRGPNSAALLSTILVLLVVVVPATLLGLAVTHELSETYHSLARGSTVSEVRSSYPLQQIEASVRWIADSFGFSEPDLRAILQKRLEEGTTYLPGLAAKLLGNATSFIVSIFTTIFTLFFLFRDGESIKQRALAFIPLNARQIDRLVTGVIDTLNASICGIIAIGLGQGFLTGLAFRVLNLPSPVLWGVVTAMFSLVPVLGTGIVWATATASRGGSLFGRVRMY
jgi:predicted PurR-regulated permease PerM